MIGRVDKTDGSTVWIDVGHKAEDPVFVIPVSADTTTGIHPQFSGVQERGNAAKLGQGLAIKRYGRGNDPNSEFTAKFRGILEGSSIPYQTHT